MASRAAVRPSPSEPPVSGLPQVHRQSPLPCLRGVCPATRRSVMLRSPMRGSVNPQNGNPSWRLDRPIPQLSRSMDFANSLITLFILPDQPYSMHVTAAQNCAQLEQANRNLNWLGMSMLPATVDRLLHGSSYRKAKGTHRSVSSFAALPAARFAGSDMW